jgi:dUTP diphosphatase
MIQTESIDDHAWPGVLSREQIRALIERPDGPLVSEWRDLDEQLQPNGLDLSLAAVSRLTGMGRIGARSAERELPSMVPVPFDADGWVTLPPGPYHILYNEVVNLPPDIMALGRPRSSLARSGVSIHTAVWDAGYVGRSTSLLVVQNPAGFQVQRNARVMQLVFLGLAAATAIGYEGRYQHENMAAPEQDQDSYRRRS